VSKETYIETKRASREAVAETLPKIVLDVSAAVLIWLFGKLVFLPIAEGIDFYGYPLPEFLNFVILVTLVVIMFKVIVDVRKFIDGLAGYTAIVIGADYDVTEEEVTHYKTALGGLFDVIVVSLAYTLLVDYFSGIHPALAGVTLLALVVWAIFKLWSVVQSISGEIRRYTARWSRKALEE
jgi:hypothetical protein